MPSSPSQKRCRLSGWSGGAKPGRVVKVASISDMEETSHQQDAKGVLLTRGPNHCEKKMMQWACTERATPDHFACEHALVHFGSEGSDSSQRHGQTTSATQNINDACVRLVEKVPEAFRGVMREDAEVLANMMHRLLPDVPWLRIAIEIVGGNHCWRWHQDNYVGRMIITYAGPGTWVVNDESVNFDLFHERGSKNNRVVPDFDSIIRPPSNSVCLIKGRYWPGISGTGLIHKAPEEFKGDPTPYNGEHRLVLKVELANKKIV